MRKLFLNTRAIPIFALLTFLWSCKKVELESGIQSKEKFDIQQVVGWLESKKISDKSERNLKINELINGINQEGLWMERINEQESLIVIPLNETYTPQNDIKAEHINYLLILASNDLKIKQASVVQFAPKDESINSLPKNTFSKIFTNQNITLEGQLFVFSITGRYKYDLTFVNGKRSKLREIARFENSKGADGFNYRTNQQCWTFYTVITTWYADGSHDSETYNNGTFCYACGEINPIGQTVQCTEINNDDGSNTGGEYIEYESEYVVKSTNEWIISDLPTELGGGTIQETLNFTGKRSDNNSSKDRFTGGGSTNLRTVGNTIPGDKIWTINSHTITYPSNKQALINTNGKVTFINASFFNYSKEETINMNDLIWVR